VTRAQRSSYTVGPALAEGERPWPCDWEWDPRVAVCDHAWETVLVRHLGSRFEECVRCRYCHCPRCGHSVDMDPCMLQRHHRQRHRTLSGQEPPVGIA
jgi:hypothetical protein